VCSYEDLKGRPDLRAEAHRRASDLEQAQDADVLANASVT